MEFSCRTSSTKRDANLPDPLTRTASRPPAGHRGAPVRAFAAVQRLTSHITWPSPVRQRILIFEKPQACAARTRTAPLTVQIPRAERACRGAAQPTPCERPRPPRPGPPRARRPCFPHGRPTYCGIIASQAKALSATTSGTTTPGAATRRNPTSGGCAAEPPTSAASWEPTCTIPYAEPRI